MLNLSEKFIFRNQTVAWGMMGQGSPIVLIHGFPWNAQAWRNIAPWLAQNNKVYFFDMVGAGLSEKTDGQDVNEAVQSDLLEALITHWGLDAPQIVGHDFGGLAALRGHFINGLSYSKLHLINSVALLPSGSPFYAHVAHHETAFAGMPDYAFEAVFKAYIQNAAHYALRGEAIETYMEPWLGDGGKAAFFRQIAQADTDNIKQVQKLYQKPAFDVHILWGMNDTFIPLERGRKLAGLLQADSFTQIPNAAHIVQEDAPEAIVATILKNI